MGADDQVVFSLLHDQVMHRHAGQIAVQRAERCAGVRGEVGAAVGAHHPPSGVVFQLDQGVDGFRGQVLAPTLPGFSAVACRKHPRVQRVVPVPVQRHHKQVGVVVRPHHFRDPGVLDAVAFAEGVGMGMFSWVRRAPRPSTRARGRRRCPPPIGQTVQGVLPGWSRCRTARFQHVRHGSSPR